MLPETIQAVLPLIPAVVALVALLRSKWPAIDGPMYVAAATLLISFGFVFAYGLGTSVVAVARYAVGLALSSFGAVWGVDRVASRIGEAAKPTDTPE